MTVLLALGLGSAACRRVPATPEAQPTPAALVPCATGDRPLTRSCTAERFADPHGGGLVVRNPDGGFHRLRPGDQGWAAADGAAPAAVAPVDATHVDVRIGPDRYRLHR